jgi:hypothetical protein
MSWHSGRLVGVAEGKAGTDLVAIPPSDTLARHIAGVDEVVHETLCRPFRDSDPLRDLAQADLGVFGYAEERTGVIRKESPAHPVVALVAASHLDRRQMVPIPARKGSQTHVATQSLKSRNSNRRKPRWAFMNRRSGFSVLQHRT